MALNDKQQRFVEEYLVDFNATQAAIRAGYSAKTAEQQGCRLLRNVQVAAAVDAGRAALSERAEITQDYVLAGLQEVAERCMEREPVMVREGQQLVHQRDEEGRFVYKFDAPGANRAFQLLGLHLGMFEANVKHKHEHEHNHQGEIKMTAEERRNMLADRLREHIAKHGAGTKELPPPTPTSH